MSSLQIKMNFLLLLFLTLLLFPQLAESQGYTFSSCSTDQGCVGSRTCRDVPTELSQPCDYNSYVINCLCIPPTINDLICTESSKCDQGEVCTDLLKNLLNDATIPDGLCVDKSQLPYLETPKKCETDLDCAPVGVCITISSFSYCGASMSALSNSTTEETTMPELATLEPSLIAEETTLPELATLQPGLIAEETTLPGLETFEPSLTAEETTMPELATLEPVENDSESMLPQSSTEGGDACIAVHSLKHLPITSLKYLNHRMATVLCDENHSCATPGHMIMFRGDAMMMKSYCHIVGCKKITMAVNSPRYERRLRVPSNTVHLSFLAFAARYGTRTEERMFQTAVRVGL